MPREIDGFTLATAKEIRESLLDFPDDAPVVAFANGHWYPAGAPTLVDGCVEMGCGWMELPEKWGPSRMP